MISAEDLKRQARRHEAAGRYDRAVECYERALERLRVEGSVESTVDSSLYLSLADLHFRQGDVDSALERYRAAADQYARLGLTRNAVSVHKMSRRLFPDRAEPYVHLAEIYLRVGKLDRAREQARLLAGQMEESGELTPSDVGRTASRFREDGPGEADPRPELISLLEEAGCLPEGEWEAGPGGGPAPEDDGETGEEPGSGRESRLMEDLESLEEIGRMMTEEESVEQGDEGRRGGDETTEMAAPEADEIEEEHAAEDGPPAEAAEEAADEATDEDAAGWDFLAPLRSARRSRPSRPGKSDREEAPEYAGPGPKSEWERDAEEPLRSEEPVDHGEPPQARPSMAEEGTSEEDVEDADSPRTWKEEIEEDLAEATSGGEPEESDKPGLQSAAPVEDGSIHRSRRWNWPPSEATEDEREAGDREYELDPRDGVGDARWSVGPSDESDAPDESDVSDAPDESVPDAPEAHAPRPDERDDPGDQEPGTPPWATTGEAEPAEQPERPEQAPEVPEATDGGAPGEAEAPRRDRSRRPGAELRAGLEVIREMLDLRPGAPDLLRRKAAYARRLGDESLLVESWLEMARSLQGKDGSRGARLLALRVLEMDPDNREAREILRPLDRAAASAQADAGSGPTAGLDPDAPDADASLRRRAAREFAEEVGSFQWLEAATEVSLLADESLPDDFFHYYGRYLMTRGRWDDAAVMLERAAGNGEDLAAGEHPELVFDLALIYRRLGRHDRAVRCFRSLAEAEESFATAWRSLPESGAA